eukprot:GHVN01008393.1.p2 GENE.GHVN01008393.1~~GHVN01008393.1.p2  ORF type:complete len:162 (+),score=40.74 GHVN01008393.1:1293-1778(+)
MIPKIPCGDMLCETTPISLSLGLKLGQSSTECDLKFASRTQLTQNSTRSSSAQHTRPAISTHSPSALNTLTKLTQRTQRTQHTHQRAQHTDPAHSTHSSNALNTLTQRALKTLNTLELAHEQSEHGDKKMHERKSCASHQFMYTPKQFTSLCVRLDPRILT